MSETPRDTRPHERDVDSRADLLPEEWAAGSEQPHDQAEAVLAESEERVLDPEGTQLASTQTPDDGRTSEQPVT
jgi:hypothetical protein